MTELPPCGLYKTTVSLSQHLPAGQLVYFHNHGQPGAGVYLPQSWNFNRVIWQDQGHVIPNEAWAQTLAPLPPEGLYRVVESFFCCSQNCQRFETDMLVQLGYNGRAEAILFLPELTSQGMAFPEKGSAFDLSNKSKLSALRVVTSRLPKGGPIH